MVVVVVGGGGGGGSDGGDALNGVLGLELVILIPGFGSRQWVHNALSTAVSSGLIKSFKFGSPEVTISHLFYADDMIITTEWNANDLDNIIRVLQVFYSTSGLKINIKKYNVYGNGVSDVDVSSMASNSGCASGSFPFTYRGLPIGSNMSLTSSWQPNLGARNSVDLLDILFEISSTEINEVEDTCVWSLGTDGTFSVKDDRCIIDSKILAYLTPSTVWDKNIPRKANINIWRLILDRLPHKLNLSSRGIDIQAISCPSCNGNVESSNHIIFECNIAKDIWMLVRKWCDISFPPSTSYEHWKVIMEYFGKISKKARILELKRRNLKNTVLTFYTPYPSRKIRRIYACTSQEPRRTKSYTPYLEDFHTPYPRYSN
ncbi:RNA-directed DNA polymerase, eukaryota, reverse transcriptase zinc-binding domain protein [Tanacetum coccineum]